MFKKTLCFIIIIVALFSCHKEKDAPVEPDNPFPDGIAFIGDDSTDVSMDTAMSIAIRFTQSREFYNSEEEWESTPQYEPEEVMAIPDENGEPAMYVVNFSPKGFSIISATAKETPVLGYSSEYSFRLEDIPKGLTDWFYDRIYTIQTIRNNKDYEIPIEVTADWGAFYVDESDETEGETDEVEGESAARGGTYPGTNSRWTLADFILKIFRDEVIQKGPLLTSKSGVWHQRAPYNNLAPKGNCTNTSNGRKLTGCVATATAQILRYHEYPASQYNWKVIPGYFDPRNPDIESAGAREVARLLRDVGKYVKMDYGCKESSAMTNKAIKVFEDKFNYASGGKYETLSFAKAESKVKMDIMNKRPVIMDGYENRHYKFFQRVIKFFGGKPKYYYTEGHAWVCDGFKRKIFQGIIFLIPFESKTEYFHMNWGWGGAFTGWFLMDNITLNNGATNFHYNRNYITGITPYTVGVSGG